jgi:hypothetical protein
MIPLQLILSVSHASMASNTEIHFLNNIAHSPRLHSNSFTLMSMKSKSLLLLDSSTGSPSLMTTPTVIPLKKSDVFSAFKSFKAYAENHHGLKIKALQDDKGGEYMSNEMKQYLG